MLHTSHVAVCAPSKAKRCRDCLQTASRYDFAVVIQPCLQARLQNSSDHTQESGMACASNRTLTCKAMLIKALLTSWHFLRHIGNINALLLNVAMNEVCLCSKHCSSRLVKHTSPDWVPYMA